MVSTLEVSDGKFAFAFWTYANGASIATCTPTPEPATGGLRLLGIGLVFVIRNRIGQGLPQNC